MSATKHKPDCTRVFKNYDLTCPRCLELSQGAPARDGWQADYYRRSAERAVQRNNVIREHFAPGGPHATGKCGPVCTAFDW